jgi:hypothetical protein
MLNAVTKGIKREKDDLLEAQDGEFGPSDGNPATKSIKLALSIRLSFMSKHRT